MTAPRPQRSIPTVAEVAGKFPEWLRTHAGAAIASAVIGGIVGYAWNVFLIAVRYNGDSKVPPGAPATASGNFIQGGLFWGLCGMVIFGAGGYWRAVGTQRFFADLRGLPAALGGLIRGDRGAGVHLLWGAAASMLAALILSPATGAILAIGMLATAPRLIGSIIANLVRQVWSGLLKRIAPTRAHAVTGIAGVTVGILGSAFALLAAFLIPYFWLKLVLAVVLAVAAVALSRTVPPAAVMLALFATLPFVAWLTNPALAFADDGGWTECTVYGGSWFGCTGTSTVFRNSTLGGAASAAGAVLGDFLGNLAGTLGDDGSGGQPPWQPSPDMPPGDRAAINSWIRQLLDDPAFQRWRATHPGYIDPPSDAEFNAYLDWRRAQGMADPPLTLPSQQAAGPIDVPLPPVDDDVALPPLPDLPPVWEPFDVPPG